MDEIAKILEKIQTELYTIPCTVVIGPCDEETRTTIRDILEKEDYSVAFHYKLSEGWSVTVF